MFYNENIASGRDYKYTKIRCVRRQDYKALLKIKYIDVEGVTARMMAKMNKDKIEETFNNKALNCIIKKIPSGWNHKDLYEYCKQFGELLSVKVSKSFYWGGKSMKDDAGKTIKREDFLGNLVGNPMFEAWKATQYDILPNGYGYACFKNEESQKNCLDNYWRQDNFLDIQTPQGMTIQQFEISKRQIQQVSNVVFFKNFPQTYTRD
jgi:RNA recognition motif-containing protein